MAKYNMSQSDAAKKFDEQLNGIDLIHTVENIMGVKAKEEEVMGNNKVYVLTGICCNEDAGNTLDYQKVFSNEERTLVAMKKLTDRYEKEEGDVPLYGDCKFGPISIGAMVVKINEMSVDDWNDES